MTINFFYIAKIFPTLPRNMSKWYCETVNTVTATAPYRLTAIKKRNVFPIVLFYFIQRNDSSCSYEMETQRGRTPNDIYVRGNEVLHRLEMINFLLTGDNEKN